MENKEIVCLTALYAVGLKHFKPTIHKFSALVLQAVFLSEHSTELSEPTSI